MSEASTTAVATEPVPAANIKHKSPGLLNQAQARALTKAEKTGIAAGHPDHAPALDGRAISKAFVAQFPTDVDAARDLAANAVASTTARKNATAAATIAAYSLIGGLQEVQKAAKQSYSRTNRIALNDYLIGQKLNGSRLNLLQTSQTILNKAGADPLPGMTPAKLKALRTARQSWIDAHTAQTESKATALPHRAGLKDVLKSIKDRKVAIQLARMRNGRARMRSTRGFAGSLSCRSNGVWWCDLQLIRTGNPVGARVVPTRSTFVGKAV